MVALSKTIAAFLTLSLPLVSSFVNSVMRKVSLLNKNFVISYLEGGHDIDY